MSELPKRIYVWRHGDDEPINGMWIDCDDTLNPGVEYTRTQPQAPKAGVDVIRVAGVIGQYVAEGDAMGAITALQAAGYLAKQDEREREQREIAEGLLQTAYSTIKRLEKETHGYVGRIQQLEFQLERCSIALTPSSLTKGSYLGEFKFERLQHDPDSENEFMQPITVPWTTVKEIMSAIRVRAGIELYKFADKTLDATPDA